MKPYLQIKTKEELCEFVGRTVSFHDSIVKELQMINRGFVQKDKAMVMELQFDCRILFQTQWDPVAFELLCVDVKHLSITGPEEFMVCQAKLDNTNNEALIELALDGDFLLQCKELYYKLCPDKYGNFEHFGSDIPSNNMVTGTNVRGSWWKCNNCGEAWEVKENRHYVACPSCNRVVNIGIT